MGEGHHRILGETVDFITGETITDTDDERYRQKIARFLVEELGFPRSAVRPRHRITIDVEGFSGYYLLDFFIVLEDRAAMAVQYGPGSLVTREHPAIAAARVAGAAPAPRAVVTNGQDAEVIDPANGKVIGQGFNAIPGPEQLLEILQKSSSVPLDPARKEKALRVLAAFEGIEHSCACSEDWCRPKKG